MKALRLTGWKTEPELVEVPKPTPGPGQVVVKVGGAGACHSDLHLMHDFDDGMMPWQLPFTLGHENAGWVDAVGDGVTTVSEGDAVAVYGAWGCGKCERCRHGVENYCEDPAAAPVISGGGGLGLDGGMAEYLLVPSARLLVRLPDGLDPATAAPLTDAGLTPYHAIRRSWPKMTPTSTVVVIGVGGLGHMALQLAKATTAAKIIAVDNRTEALDLAARMGADHTVMSDAAAADAIRDLTAGRGADVLLDFVGAEATIELSRAAARPLGDVTIVGIAGGSVPFSFFSQPYEVSMQTTYWGTRRELVELLELAARGCVHVETTRYSLDDALRAYHDLRDGDVRGRAVIIP
ncbi:NAD(P)-dependent alcohol dehydrogenase [Mycolicibacterium holsaticum]|jgi:propanol-preferring alcohol dehydrogenase|uniref:NAD(P)-dependent alcohol dehydrogenase n=1 Tax=Mycolicibacterium holsaticum TaxID=152142 RepID=UPI001C7DF3D9|nr:NAD(P)-dependent alcohol dehydrogenase [Mycolicibacterium holsaticum]MDA4105962.1 alcohol dehydrogenase [Mycolicibacterium holsaticum DSM 44478 = JCM 12374]QZA13698.1 NAD(P)-dependent alcohol dehydrogenase [Mycolicibacterium holsaticum DSM 44478 = JCM 12374]UNC08839.1 NAD(P)-dependent alcohol dehydrogenase [Mycolicibacterium holsaticum DSM 44478 = JCM 12374]